MGDVSRMMRVNESTLARMRAVADALAAQRGDALRSDDARLAALVAQFEAKDSSKVVVSQRDVNGVKAPVR